MADAAFVGAQPPPAASEQFPYVRLSIPDLVVSEGQKRYREVYLKSDHWRRMRRLALEDADHRCAVCNATEHLDVHHRTYERLGNERLTDLLVLCRSCHDIFHQNGRLAGSRVVAKSQTAKKPGALGQGRVEDGESARICTRLVEILQADPERVFRTSELGGLLWISASRVGPRLASLRSRGVIRGGNGKWQFETPMPVSGTKHQRELARAKATVKAKPKKLSLTDRDIESLQQQQRGNRGRSEGRTGSSAFVPRPLNLRLRNDVGRSNLNGVVKEGDVGASAGAGGDAG